MLSADPVNKMELIAKLFHQKSKNQIKLEIIIIQHISNTHDNVQYNMVRQLQLTSTVHIAPTCP